MAARKIIEIDEELCNGCGACISGCAEGALQLIDGKARLVSDKYCDGLGACLGACPTGALKITEREAEAYSEEAVAAKAAGKALSAPKAERHSHGGMCPGSQARVLERKQGASAPSALDGGPKQAIPSELGQWPVQLQLVQPGMPFLKGKELAVLSTCSPVASADIHWRFMRGRAVVVACPKLDRTEGYVEKLAEILAEPSIPRVLVVRIEVPCCAGLTKIVREAAALSGRVDLEVQEIVVGRNGDIPA